MSDKQVHFASVDLEDWYIDVERTLPEGSKSAREAFDRQVGRIMTLLAETKSTCTFFVLGKTAERYPEWISRIHNAGHEIASHGYGHDRVDSLTRSEFEADVKRAALSLESITGERPVGYRAPYFSVSRDQLWFYDVLADHGFRYSSSVFPYRGRHEGMDDHPLDPVDVTCEDGSLIREYPAAVLDVAGRRVPVAGGGFWRMLPSWVIHRSIRRFERDRRSFVFYLHPHEFDDRPLRSGNGPVRDAYVNLGRASVFGKLRSVLGRHDFRRFAAETAPAGTT
jgi:polysaccharide deacetylase family protein (PEP-CTERM system associated)